jgi:dUTP pyrophosphatase
MRGYGQLEVYKMYDDVSLPRMATAGSACFDFEAYLIDGQELQSKDCLWKQQIVEDGEVRIAPLGRMLIPTGLIADIPKNHSLRIHPRSGLAFNRGLALANQEGIVDDDYKEEIFIAIINLSSETQTITNHMRIAQGELVAHEMYRIIETSTSPSHTTARTGGFGSTGY